MCKRKYSDKRERKNECNKGCRNEIVYWKRIDTFTNFHGYKYFKLNIFVQYKVCVKKSSF